MFFNYYFIIIEVYLLEKEWSIISEKIIFLFTRQQIKKQGKKLTIIVTASGYKRCLVTYVKLQKYICLAKFYF